MTYRPMRFDPGYRPFVSPVSIYVLPLAPGPERYRVLSPGGLRRKLLDLAIQGKLSIRQFPGCPKEAAEAVKAELRRLCARQAAGYGARLARLTTAGGALAGLGLVNLVLPDPLPLADELLMMLGGGAMMYVGIGRRRRNLPGLRDKVEAARERLDRLEPVDDPLLGRIYAAIRAKASPELPEPESRAVDPVEAEAAWLVRHLDLSVPLAEGETSLEELRRLLVVLEDALPLARVRALDRRVRNDPADRGARKAFARLAARHGMSRDALSVYAEFARVAGEVLEE